MSERIYWSQLKTEELNKVNLSFRDFFKILDCYYGNIFVTDGNGMVLYFNKSCGDVMGLSRKEHIGKHVSFFQKGGVFSKSATLEVLGNKQKVEVESFDYKGKPFFVHAIPIFDDNDNIIMTVHYSHHESEILRFLDEVAKKRNLIDMMSGVPEHYTKKISKSMELIYRSEQMSNIVEMANKIAKTDSTVFIKGESGTGKEVLARYIFKKSNRNKKEFIPINCAGVPEELIESELFGYLPGAFTGARKEGKMGVFELADRGTLFLDEVSEIPLSKQAKLLRVLENGELMKIGATSSKRIDVRIIAATNRDLESMIQNKTFREDLFYRLNVIPLVLPPLRDRPEDILLLAKYFLRKYNDKYQTHKEFSKSCETKFVRYKWPGNVRELKNIIHRMVITSEGDVIEPVELGVSCSLSPIALKAPSEFAGSDLKTAIQNYEIRCINQAITASEGNITRAAQKLGVHRTYIYRKMKKQSCEH